jgi:hypothetical protein
MEIVTVGVMDVSYAESSIGPGRRGRSNLSRQANTGSRLSLDALNGLEIAFATPHHHWRNPADPCEFVLTRERRWSSSYSR